MALNSGTIIKGYEIKETIGSGAMSIVYLAQRRNRSYAVKELRTDFSSSEEEKICINAFQREADLLYSLDHPGLPRLYTNFKYNGKSYLVMEYIKGKSLEDIIKDRTKPFEEEKALRLGIQICEILCYLHNLSPEPVIYRDLKPSNIIVTGEDRLRLIDFGVVRRYDPDKDCDTVRLGTPGYAAPEQCRKKGQSIPQSDIYALGVVLHQLLTLYDPSVTPFKLPAIRKLNPAVPEQMEYLINKILSYRNGLKTVFTPAPSATAIPAETSEPTEILEGYLIVPGEGMADLRINESTMEDVKKLLGEPDGIPVEERGNIKVVYDKENFTFWFTADKYILRGIWIRNRSCQR